MRSVKKPSVAILETFELCLDTITDAKLVKRYQGIYSKIDRASDQYQDKVKDCELYTLAPCNKKNKEVVVGGVTKKELKKLYTDHFVPKKKPARKIYDLLINAAKGGKCPTCGVGHVYTLDHYLVKSKYPLLSVLPLNLIPACQDCNKLKHTTVATCKEKQAFHPYFDQKILEGEQWLFARVIEIHSPVIEFYADGPRSWDSCTEKRADTHLKDFNLPTRFGTEAACQLLSISQDIARFRTKELRYKELKYRYDIEKNIELNSWRTAFFYALINSDWYLDKGFDFFNQL